MTRILAIAFAVLATMPAVAEARAGPIGPAPDALAISLAVADQAWGNVPCRGRVTVQWVAGLSDPYTGVQLNGWAAGADPRGPRSCLILLDTRLQPDSTGVHGRLCDVVVHEVGHLAGHTHEEGGVMTPGTGVWPGCHPITSKRQQATDQLRVILPAGHRWTLACTPTVDRCVARAADARARRYTFQWRRDGSLYTITEAR